MVNSPGFNAINSDSVGNVLNIVNKNVTALMEESRYNAMNRATCIDAEIPDMQTYLAALSKYGVGIMVYGSITVVIIIFVIISTIVHVFKSGEHKSRIAFILTSYPVVAVCLFSAIIVPRASIIADAISQCIYSFSMYQLFCLFIAYCGGESELVRTTQTDALNLKVGPCCCFPCCRLPVYTPNKRNVKILRILVLQLPIVHSVFYMIFLFVWANEKSYNLNDIYMQPLLGASILSAIWGITMTFKMLEHILDNHKLALKFLSLQCILLFTKLQGIIVKFILYFEAVPCRPPLTPDLLVAIVFNSIVLLELTILSFWARSLYRRTPPEVVIINDVPNQIDSIQTLYEGEVGKQNNTVPYFTTQISQISNNGVIPTHYARQMSHISNNNSTGYDNQNFVIDAKM